MNYNMNICKISLVIGNNFTINNAESVLSETGFSFSTTLLIYSSNLESSALIQWTTTKNQEFGMMQLK